jgi:hypothetical protein
MCKHICKASEKRPVDTQRNKVVDDISISRKYLQPDGQAALRGKVIYKGLITVNLTENVLLGDKTDNDLVSLGYISRGNFFSGFAARN